MNAEKKVKYTTQVTNKQLGDYDIKNDEVVVE